MYNLPKPRKCKPKTVIDVPPPLPESPLHMYETMPPLLEVDINKFEDVAVERCLLLRIIESATQRGLKVDSEEWRCFIRENVRVHDLSTYFTFVDLPNNEKISATEAKQNDHLSHYILRLAYCRNVDLRKRFRQLETQLFSLKFSYLSAKEKTDLYKIYCKQYEALTFLEKLVNFDELIECSEENVNVEKTDFYEVPFFKATKSLAARNVYMSRGKVYLPQFQLIECLEYQFGENLKAGLAQMLNCLDFIEKDERIKSIFDNLEALATARRRTIKSPEFNQKVRVEDVDTYAQDNYPLCMYSLHQILTTKHHLKHEARVQYGRFLKDAGFDCDQVQSIFREHFCKEITETKFTKKYSYGIKYMYGLSGRKRIQNAYDCTKIMEKEVVCGREHGCPYKHWDKGKLREVLLEKGLVLQDIEDIVRLKENGQYQAACTACFNCTHSGNYPKVVEHPNEYFEESRTRAGLLEVLIARTRELDIIEEDLQD